jgi:predicted MFS family arabinose efflux permease
VDWLGGRSVWIAFGLAEASGLALVGAGLGTTSVLLGVAVTAAGVSLLYPAAVDVIVSGTAPAEQGAGMGVLTAAWDVGMLLAGVTGGLVVASAGFRVAFALSSVVVVTSVAIVWSSPRDARASTAVSATRSSSL